MDQGKSLLLDLVVNFTILQPHSSNNNKDFATGVKTCVYTKSSMLIANLYSEIL